MEQVPVIDVSGLPDDEAALRELDRACREWGFFQIVGHGIAPAVMAATLEHMQRFFALPRARKREVERTAENVWGYYDRELTKNVRDWKEIFDVGPAETEGPLAGSTPQWPREPEGFRESMESFYAGATRVAYRLLRGIAVHLERPADYLDASFGDAHTSYLRLNYYPVCDDPAPADADTVPGAGRLGISHHTDAGAITVLLQDEQAGLQVEREGVWHTVEPVDGAFVINIGDVVQVWSNDRYPAPLHRVLASRDEPRFSAPFFFNPAYATDYAPLFDPPRYRSINWGEFRAGRAAGDYADYGEEIQISQFRLSGSALV